MSKVEDFTFYDENETPYNFQVYTTDTLFNPIAGVYMFTSRVENQQERTTTHHIRYIGETHSFRDRPLNSNHEEWANAVALGFNCICVYPTNGDRVAIQDDLIDKYNPPLNG